MQQLMRIQDEGVFIKDVSGLAQLDLEGVVKDQRCQPCRAHDAACLAVQAGDSQLRRMPENAFCRNSRAVTELVAGVTRYRRRLDQTISHLTGKPAAMAGMQTRTESNIMWGIQAWASLLSTCGSWEQS